MNDNELFKLCKEVYERFPEWGLKIVNGEIASYRSDLRFYRNSGLEGDEPTIGNEPVYDIRYIYPVPLYTSDFLLEKLPYGTSIEKTTFGFMAVNGLFQYTKSDTPLKALLKLVLALKEAGEL